MQLARILKMGMPLDCAGRMQTKIHVDQLTDTIALNSRFIQRLELSWDSENLRWVRIK